MRFAVIFCYTGADKTGEDILAVKVVNEHLDSKSAIESGEVDEFFSSITHSANVQFELYNVEYLGVKVSDADSLMVRIRENMENMLESGELVYVSDFEFSATVNVDADKGEDKQSSLVIM